MRCCLNKTGEFGTSSNEFVIFDTPGANSSTNTKHEEVLKKALEDLSNGLPIFIAKNDELDSTDNKKFVDFIKSMKRLDDRFTMIVVNKADGITFDAKQLNEESILSQAIPRLLYRGGLYYISSIVGLGAKIGGDTFISNNYDEIFYKEERTFSDSSSRHYKELYKHNIIPAQIKRECLKECEKRTSGSDKDRLYTNSGLFWIEKEIETFAQRYAPYNKCYQSKLFLDDVIDETAKEIEKAQAANENTRRQLENQFDEKEKKLVENLNKQSGLLHQTALKKYDAELEQHINTLKPNIDEAWLAEEEARISQIVEEEKQNNANKQELSFVDEIISEAENNDGNNDSGKTMFNPLKDTVERFREQSSEKKRLRDEARASYDQKATELVEKVNNLYAEEVERSQHEMVQWSENYWHEVTNGLKRKLVQVISESDDINDDRKTRLIETIMNFSSNILFGSETDEGFKWSKFKRNPFSRDSRFDTKKFVKKYQLEHKNAVKSFSKQLMFNDHLKFGNWIEELRKEVIENITKFNEGMESLMISISYTAKTIEELQKRHDDLYLYNDEIKQMMAWFDNEEEELE